MGNYIFKQNKSESMSSSTKEHIKADVGTQTTGLDSLEVNKLFVDEIYFKNSQWRIKVGKPGKMDFLFFEHYDEKTKQWKLQQRILY